MFSSEHTSEEGKSNNTLDLHIKKVVMGVADGKSKRGYLDRRQR